MSPQWSTGKAPAPSVNRGAHPEAAAPGNGVPAVVRGQRPLIAGQGRSRTPLRRLPGAPSSRWREDGTGRRAAPRPEKTWSGGSGALAKRIAAF